MRSLAAALALAVVTTGGAAAPARSPAHHVKSTHQLYMYAPDDPNPARDEAIHDCSVSASKWNFYLWQTTQFAIYGTCMTERGQPQ